jgi:predicted DNA-binding WGR domain protein
VPRFPTYVGERNDVTWDTLSPLPQNRGRPADDSSKKSKKKSSSKKSSPKPAATPSSSGGPLVGFRRFEFDDGASQKFWEVATTGADVLVRFGRLGTDGRVHIKTKKTAADAEAHADKQADSKIAKGYDEVQGAQPPAEFTAAASAATTTSGGASPTIVTQTQHQRGTGDDLRRLEFDDGSSQKFWEIERWGNELVIRFGKLGTDGQVRVKTYDDATKARADATKQADKKISRGYVEQ